MRIRNTIIAGILVSFISLVEAESSYKYIEQHPLKIAVANNIEMSYREIAAKLNASTTTITRVARFLTNEPYKGYQKILKRINNEK